MDTSTPAPEPKANESVNFKEFFTKKGIENPPQLLLIAAWKEVKATLTKLSLEHQAAEHGFTLTVKKKPRKASSNS